MIPDISSLPDRIRSDVVRVLRNIGLRMPKIQLPAKLIVVIADGLPDAIIASLLLHKLDGKWMAGIFRPSQLGFDNIGRNISTYMHRGLRQNAYLVIVDQEEASLDDAWRRIEKSLRDYGLSYSEVKGDLRWKLYECRHGTTEFRLAVAISGQETPYQKHTIEDHLLTLAIIKGYTDEDEIKKHNNPKDAWENLCRRISNLKTKIFEEIATESEKAIIKIFEQHIKAIKELTTES